MMKPMRLALLAAIAAQPFAAGAFTPDDYLAWLKANQDAQPQFVDGDVITYDKADLIRPFTPAEYQDIQIFEGMEVKIKDAGDISPPEIYKKATEQFAGQATIAADGALENYTAGRPFDPATFKPGKEDGQKMIWNFNFRWQLGGLSNKEVHWVWVRAGGEHSNHEVMGEGGGKYKPYYQGGGSFERVLAGPYRRVMFSHRSDMPESNYKVNNGEGFAKGTEFREYTGFASPFDIAGTAFLILRYDDPRKSDDSWAYIPSLRRVRRISVSEVRLAAGHGPHAGRLLLLQRPSARARVGVRRLRPYAGRRAFPQFRRRLLRPERLGDARRLGTAHGRRHEADSEARQPPVLAEVHPH